MSRTRLFGASLALSLLANICILIIVGAMGPPDTLMLSLQRLKAIPVRLYHPPLAAKPPPNLVKEPRHVRANPMPPSNHPTRQVSASRPTSLGHRPARVTAVVRRQTPEKPARQEESIRHQQPAPLAPKVIREAKVDAIPAPVASQDQGIGAGAKPSEPAESGSAGGQGDSSGTGEAPGSGNGGGGPFGVGSGGGGEGLRHIVYVLDVSPSMETRISRARQELENSIYSLGHDETFDIIAFGGETHPFADGLVSASPEEIHAANRFLSTVAFIPGTDLQSALYAALDEPGVNVVVLITDGVPTVGETDFGKIARHIRKHNGAHARIYTIGLVGKNPDGTDQSFEAGQLLNQIAGDSGGELRLVPLGEATPDE